MSLNLYNKILSIIEEEHEQNFNNDIGTDSPKIHGGVAMANTMENLVGGDTNTNTSEQNLTPNIVMTDSSDKLEGGVRKSKKKKVKEIDEPPTTKRINENLFEGGNKNKYSDFLRRLNSTELFHDNSQDNNSSKIIGGDIGKSNNTEDNDDNVVEVLPMFPYLIRY